MQNKLEKALGSAKLIAVFGILSAVLQIASDLPFCFLEDYAWYKFDVLTDIVSAAAIIGLLVAYKKGEINVQKALLGAIIFNGAVGTFSNFVYYLDGISAGEDYKYELFLFLAFSISELGIFVAHLVLQSDHAGSVKAIKFIEVFVLIAIVADIVDTVITLQAGVDYFALYLLNNFGVDLYLLMILCIELTVQKYKSIRTAALAEGTWTPEAKAEAKKLFKF